MPRQWRESGVANEHPLRLREETKEQIRSLLKVRGIRHSENQEFFDSLAVAIGLYDGLTELRQTLLPASVRANLDGAVKAVTKLRRALFDLDGNSCQLLQDSCNGGVLELRDYSNRIFEALTRARKLADEYPGKASGRLPDHPRMFLAADVAHAVITFLGEQPTASQEGLFEELLHVVLEEATGKEAHSVHDLAQKVLASPMRRSTSDGIVFYEPPNRDE